MISVPVNVMISQYGFIGDLFTDNLIGLIFVLISLHFLGDYVFQSEYMAKIKGTNWYLLLGHCFLYSFPFLVFFGFTWQYFILLMIHFLVDSLKARYHKINLFVDQMIHLLTLLLYLY